MHGTVSLAIDAELLIRFPALQLGGFVAVGLDRVSSTLRADDLEELLQASAGAIAFEHAARVRPLVTSARLITLCRAIGLRHLVGLTGYDLDALPSSDITIRAARPASDWFMPLGARVTDAPLHRGIIVHAAGPLVLSRAFNDVESRQTCVSAATRRAVFVSDAVSSEQGDAAAAALDDLRCRLAGWGARVGATVFVDAWTPCAELVREIAPSRG